MSQASRPRDSKGSACAGGKRSGRARSDSLLTGNGEQPEAGAGFQGQSNSSYAATNNTKSASSTNPSEFRSAGQPAGMVGSAQSSRL